MRNYDLIRETTSAAADRWPMVLSQLGIDVPRSPRQHAPCPACGGKDRFRFDDNGRGSFICNQCGAGDGLDLIKRVNNCDTTEAAHLAADVLGIDYRAAQTDQTAASQRREQLEADRQQREQERQQQAAEAQRRRDDFESQYGRLSGQATEGESEYLIGKGLDGFTFPVLPDGSLLLPLVDKSGAVVAAQTITPQGEKRLVRGSAKRGAYHAVNAPESPATVLIAEGLATALSVHLMRPDALTVVAVDAGNLLHVAKAMREAHQHARIIIAADNDRHDDDTANTGREAAEKAALSVDGWVSLPPTEEKADWDDYRQQRGSGAAAEAFNASLYQPEGKSMGAQLKAIEGGKGGKPESDPLKPRVEVRKSGIYWVAPKMDKETGEIINNESWLSTTFEVIGEGSDKDTDSSYTILRWEHQGSERVRIIEGGAVGDSDGWRIMKNGGLKITSKHFMRAILSDWMQKQSEEAPRMKVTPRAGWCDGVYIMPDGAVMGESDTPVLFSGGTAARGAYSVAGTTESWRDNVAALAKGNPFQMLSAAVALAAPMVGITGADGFGVHMYADSTAGKTTAEDFGSSIYGLPERQRLTWYGTALGIANEAEAHNDGLLCLDEIGQGTKPQDVFTSAYTLFNGKGKLQADKNGGNRTLKYWKTVVISTGETSVENYLLSAGIKIKAGQLIRLLNVPVTRPTKLHGYQDGKDHADALKAGWTDHHGAAGREWIEYLAANPEKAKRAYSEAQKRWKALIPARYGEQVHRASDRFAALEAALVLGSFITGWSEQECRDAIQYIFNVWVAEFGTGNKEDEQIVEQATAFLMANGISRFIPIDFEEMSQLNVHNLAGYKDKGESGAGDPITFYVLPETFKKEVSKDFDANRVATALHSAGMLRKPASDKGWQVKTPRIKHLNNSQIRAYAVLLIDGGKED